jgi:hypothetical protein
MVHALVCNLLKGSFFEMKIKSLLLQGCIALGLYIWSLVVLCSSHIRGLCLVLPIQCIVLDHNLTWFNLCNCLTLGSNLCIVHSVGHRSMRLKPFST